MKCHDEMFMDVATDLQTKSPHKVTVVGIGAVGMAAAFSVLTQVSFACNCHIGCALK